MFLLKGIDTMIVDEISEWQYLIMGAVGFSLLAIALQAIYIYALHTKLDRTRSDGKTITDEMKHDMLIMRAEVDRIRILREDRVWNGQPWRPVQ